MKRKVIKIIFIVLLIGTLIGAYEAYHTYVQYKFTTISKDRFYRSGAMPPEKLVKLVNDKQIKTVIDLRHGGIGDDLNPEDKASILLEKKALGGVSGVNYINIPSDQTPTEENLKQFYEVINNEKNYPILVHCHHGIGRAAIYSALYRIEKENYTPDEARRAARPFSSINNFSPTSVKGAYLLKYKKANP